MISRAKIAANRSNARRSRGPRSTDGKFGVSRNALRHGLAAVTRRDPARSSEIERMARAICGPDTNPLLFEQALMIAANQIVLLCVRTERVAAIERLRDITATPLAKPNNSLERAKARFREAQLAYERLVQVKAKNADTGQARDSAQNPASEATQPARQPKPTRSRDEFDAMRHAMPDLDRLERYERRAWSRRKRAIRNFIEIKLRKDSING
jgi:hypothetical protein